MNFEIAIVEPNVLTSLGLRGILKEIIPSAAIRTFASFVELMDDTPFMYAHYFVASRIYFEHSQFFREQQGKSIVLVGGDEMPQLCGVMTLNICQDEKSLVRDILALRNRGPHSPEHKVGSVTNNSIGLSVREIEVCSLLSKGMTNKEIAERLSISLTTVITHRKNIMEKLSANSLADIIIYSVMNGLVDINEI